MPVELAGCTAFPRPLGLQIDTVESNPQKPSKKLTNIKKPIQTQTVVAPNAKVNENSEAKNFEKKISAGFWSEPQ